MLELIAQNEWKMSIEAKNDTVLLEGCIELGCTEQIHDILVEFFNIGVETDYIFVAEGIVEQDIMDFLYNFEMARQVEEGYIPTMFYGLMGRDIIAAVKEVIEKNRPVIVC